MRAGHDDKQGALTNWDSATGERLYAGRNVREDLSPCFHVGLQGRGLQMHLNLPAA